MNLSTFDSASWRELRAHVAADGRPAALRAPLAAVAPDLRALGVPPSTIEAIDQGLGGRGWDDAVQAFGRAADAPACFYLGPMQADESERHTMGLLLLAATPATAAVVERVEALATPLGVRMFGFPLQAHGRHVEFYDTVLAEGPFARGAGRYIAPFTPFYLGGWRDADRQHQMRRTILLHDVVCRRFQARTRRFSDRLRIDEAAPAYEHASDADLAGAVALWLTLHELMHGSGPLPLFGAPVRKIPLGAAYGGIEEFRVDATIWLLLGACSDLLGDRAGLARDLILGERLVRAARAGLGAGRALREDFDAEQGWLWLALSTRTGATLDTSGVMHVSRARIAEQLTDVLAELYAAEDAAACAPATGGIALCAFAERLRAHVFGSGVEPCLPALAARWLRSLPAHAALPVGALPSRALQP